MLSILKNKWVRTIETWTNSSHTSWDFSIFVSNNTKKSRFIDIFSQKCVYADGSNFFVSENYWISFSDFLDVLLKRSFPESFVFWNGLELYIQKNTKNIRKNRKPKIRYRYADGYSPWEPQMTKHPGNERITICQNFSENLSFQFWKTKKLASWEASFFIYLKKSWVGNEVSWPFKRGGGG